ncbi:probable inactive receptor kinase RLK902 [Aegilops tauschii subsp. strangulata]|uniref:Protein kinase domain-containing protein n=1 Tax=Aegilops tauschii subsp. strangulata TaxID=200361 RepID=A0A453KSJ5_AEGTS|nr:probable inactive receptor kinase RLK902 [Aegilops tauschii subsp. strangulata]
MPLRGRGRSLLLLVVALWCSALRCAAPDLAADRAALLALRAAVGPGLPWDASAASPCGWRGVGCDNGTGGGRVVALQLPGAGLIGQLPLGTVGNLTALRALSLRSNALSGGIPADIGNCGELRYLYLQDNKLAGEIPEGFFLLGLLQRLVLSNNRFSGGVSLEFNKLRRLATLYLENNVLTGTLPADLDLPNLQLFNVSDNQLNGPVPESLAGRPASAFSGTTLCGAPLSPCANTSPPSPLPLPPPASSEDSKSSKLSTAAIAGIAAGAVAALLVVLAVIFFMLCFRRGKTNKADTSTETAAYGDEDASPETVSVARAEKSGVKASRSSKPTASDAKKLVFVGGEPEVAYELESLLHASAEVLGKGWLGTTYRATLEGGVAVVTVKRLREVPIPEKEFRGTVAALGALRHESLVPLRSYFYSKEEKLIVYDFVSAKGLSSLLHGAGSERLDFTTRARIALASARGIAFIHGAGAGSSHGNIKSSNILVNDARDGAYVADYGLVQLVGASVPLKRVTGYRAPEVTDPRRASQEADVYSFGVLLLELLTGKAPANSVPGSDGAADLPQWVGTVVQEEWTGEVFDASIANEALVEEEMVRLLQLGTECTERRPDRRPAMAEVAARIEDIVGSAQRKTDSAEFHSVSADHSA